MVKATALAVAFLCCWPMPKVLYFYVLAMKLSPLFIGTAALLGIVLFSCSRQYSTTNRAYKKQAKKYARLLQQYPLRDTIENATEFVGTVNFTMRKPNFVIIHHTAQNTCEQTLKTFTLKSTQVSAHYVICKDGTVFHMLNDYLRAHHAGVARWGNTTDLNSGSIGIELDNNGFETFTPAQITSLLGLLKRLKSSFAIPTANFIGHGDIAPTRKNDPNWRFPWQELAQNGYGLWYDDTSKVQVPETFNSLQALRIIGYDVKDTNAAIIAFKRHFLQDTTPVLQAPARKILYSLYKKY